MTAHGVVHRTAVLPLGAARRHIVPRQHLRRWEIPPATSLFDAVHTRDNLWTGGVAEFGRDATPAAKTYGRGRPDGLKRCVCVTWTRQHDSST